MAGEQFTGRSDGARRSAVWAVLAVFLLNLLPGSMAHLAAPATDLAGAIEICAAEGGTRIILPDGTEVPPSDRPAHDGQGCPDCITCVHACGTGCGMAAGFVALSLQVDRGGADLRLLAASTFTPQQSFPLRPPGQAPPLKRA